MTQSLILLRHGKRNLGKDELNETGKAQAITRANLLSKILQPEAEIYASTKNRCRETILPLAKSLGKEVFFVEDLVERRHDEDSRAVELRIKNYFEKLSSRNAPQILICSHSDVLYFAIKELTGLSIELQEAGWCSLKYSDNTWQILDLVATETDFQNLLVSK